MGEDQHSDGVFLNRLTYSILTENEFFIPFTPFHFGLGALAKAVAPKHFSFAGFAVSQVLMDIEPGYKMLTNSSSDLHIITHNMAGASVIAVGS